MFFPLNVIAGVAVTVVVMTPDLIECHAARLAMTGSF
jgi:hypothetical protein